MILGSVFWLSSQRRFILDLPFGKIDAELEYSEVVIEWEGEAIPVESCKIRSVKTEGGYLHFIRIYMLPDKTGQFSMSVKNPHGELLTLDTITVGWLDFATSEATGSFTGSEYIPLFVVAFLIGIFVIMLLGFLRLKGHLENSDEAIFTFGVMIFTGVFLCSSLLYYYRHLLDQYKYPIWLLVLNLAETGKKSSQLHAPDFFWPEPEPRLLRCPDCYIISNSLFIL